MNHSKRSIRNNNLPKPSRGLKAPSGTPFALATLAASLMLSFTSATFAAPAGGVVAAGAATVTGAGTRTTVTQTSQNAVINWQSFGIAAGETVQFVQPGASSVALNRVLGSDPSAIFGNLSANGKVFLVNPNGVLFGSGAAVNVGGLVASTMNISDANFMAGLYKFSGAGAGAVANEGTIHADGGFVALLGKNVSNQGVISARLGSVALAAGNAVTLDVSGDNLLNVKVDEGAVNALVRNGGLVQADGGRILLTTQAAGDLLSTAVNNTGVLQAQTLSNRNGTIMLLADMQSGTVNAGGTIDASGPSAGQTGGSVTLTGQHVGLFGARVDASGRAGGGTVLVGGDFQGKNPAVSNASATYMGADSSISADAIDSGNGGKVVLWSNDSTRAYGAITARGGSRGGDGGNVETSGAWLDVAGIKVDASAASGKSGTWLLDPADITIGAATSNATFTAGVFSPNSGVSTATVSVTEIQNALGVGGNGTDVTISTINSAAPGSGTGNITVASAISWTPTTATTLTLNAAGDVNINAAITAVRGNLIVCCGRDVNVNAKITTTNGSVLLSGGRDVTLLRGPATPALPDRNLAGVTTTDGNIAMCAARDVILNNAFDGAALVTLTTGSTTPGQDLSTRGVLRGLSLLAGNSGTGPGVAGGTVTIAAGTILKVTGPAGLAPVSIVYNPTSYLTPTDYTPFFATGDGAPFSARMLVFPGGADKVADGTTSASFSGLKGAPAGVTLAGGASASFDTSVPGANKTITFTGYTLAGPNAGNFALPVTCCAPIVSRTTGNIFAAPVVIPPPPALPPPPPPSIVPAALPFITVVPEAFVVPPTPATLVVVQAALPPQMTFVAAQPPVLVPAPAVVAPPRAAAAATDVEVPARAAKPYVAPARPRKVFRN